jgi:hypothetical protein
MPCTALLVACTIRRVFTEAHDHRRPHGSSGRLRGARLGRHVRCVLLLDVLLLGLAVTAVVLPQPALALVAGTGCVSLSGRLARFLLR